MGLENFGAHAVANRLSLAILQPVKMRAIKVIATSILNY